MNDSFTLRGKLNSIIDKVIYNLLYLCLIGSNYSVFRA